MSTTIQDFCWSGAPFRLTPTSKALYQADSQPLNLWPKRADEQYINYVIIETISRRRSRWGQMEERGRQKLLPLDTPAFPA